GLSRMSLSRSTDGRLLQAGSELLVTIGSAFPGSLSMVISCSYGLGAGRRSRAQPLDTFAVRCARHMRSRLRESRSGARDCATPRISGTGAAFYAAESATSRTWRDPLSSTTEREVLMAPTLRPRRSALYLPGNNARALEKGKTLPADVLIFDLEDAVGPDAKRDSRDKVCDAVSSGSYRPREIVVRINGLGTDW